MDRSTRPTRRGVVGAAIGAVAATVAGLRPGEVAAGRQWCRTDPVIKIGGHVVDVYVMAYVRDMKRARALATGPTELVITLPGGFHPRHLASDNGFGHGYIVSFVEIDPIPLDQFPIPVHVAAFVPMRKDGVPIRVRFVPRRKRKLARGGGEGTSNVWIEFDAPPLP